MEQFVAGDVVVIRFPFSNLRQSKSRPALVLARAEFDDLILCQITSQPYTSKLARPIDKSDFAKGSLPIKSYVRVDKLFTADPSIISRRVGKLQSKLLDSLLSEVRDLFQPSITK